MHKPRSHFIILGNLFLKNTCLLFENKIPMKRFGDSNEIADLVYFLSSDESKYITGQNIHINGGMLMV